MNLKELAKLLKPYKYVVQRNWQNLPNSIEVDGHNDLDLFVSDDDYNEVVLLTKSFDFIDVRCPADNYYPPDISLLLLTDRQEYKGFYIPFDTAYFLALYYHNIVHKQGNPYEKELARTFLRMFPPVKCRDVGVGYDIDRYYQTV
jgi:hypothetical protein